MRDHRFRASGVGTYWKIRGGKVKLAVRPLNLYVKVGDGPYENVTDVEDDGYLHRSRIATIDWPRHDNTVASRYLQQIQTQFPQGSFINLPPHQQEKRFILATLLIAFDKVHVNQADVISKLRQWSGYNPNTRVVLYTNASFTPVPEFECIQLDTLGIPCFPKASFLYDIVDLSKLQMLRSMMKLKYDCYTVIDLFKMQPIAMEEKFNTVALRKLFVFGQGFHQLENWIYICTKRHTRKVDQFADHALDVVRENQDFLRISNEFVADFIVMGFPRWIQGYRGDLNSLSRTSIFKTLSMNLPRGISSTNYDIDTLKQYLRATNLRICDAMEKQPDVANILNDRTLWMKKLYEFVDIKERVSDEFLWDAYIANNDALVITILKSDSQYKTEHVSLCRIPSSCSIQTQTVQTLRQVELQDDDPYEDEITELKSWKQSINELLLTDYPA